MRFNPENSFLSFGSRIWGLIFLWIAGTASAQIETELFPKEILPGDTAGLQIRVTAPKNQFVEMPRVKDTLSSFIEVTGIEGDTLIQGDDAIYSMRLILTGFEPGTYLVKSLPVTIDQKRYLTENKSLTVTTFQVDSTMQKMYPVKPILEEHLTWWDRNQKYLWYMIIGGIMILAIIAIIFLYLRELRRKRYVSSPLLPPFEEAQQNLNKLDRKAYLKKEDYNAFYTDLSFIVRRYFSRRFDFPAQALLSDDLAIYMKEKEYLTPNEATELTNFLHDSEQVKYGRLNIENTKHQPYREWVENIIYKTRPIVEDDVPDHI